MLKPVKLCLILLSFFLSLYINYSDQNIITHKYSVSNDNERTLSFFLNNTNNYFCVLHKNDNISSTNHLNLKSSNNLELNSLLYAVSIVKPRFVAFLVLFERNHFVNTYFRLILFPFHFFF